MNRPPMSRLPLEILSRIFRFATAPQNILGYSRKPQLWDTYWLVEIGSVCSQWHRVTHSSPRLWSTLALHPTESLQVTHYTALLQLHLEQVGVNGLSIYLSDWEEVHEGEIEEILNIILCEHPGKLKSLHVGDGGRGRCGVAWPLLIKYAGDDREFSELEELELAWTPEVVEDQLNEILLFRNSPHLRALSLYGVWHPSHIPFRFPFQQLTKLQLQHISPDFALECLSKCPNLIEFSYSGFPAPWSPSDGLWDPPENESVTINSLRRLSWTATSDKPVGIKLFDHFRFPSLHYLEWDRQLPSNAPPVHDFFAQMENLQELRFSPLLNPTKEFGIEHHLHCFRNLLKLKMPIVSEDPPLSHGWLHRLTIKPGNQNLFPHLQKLHLTTSEDGSHGLLVILCSRRNGPIDWSDPSKQYPENLVVPSYDPTSAHWKDHSRLMQFEYEASDTSIESMDWTQSPHYPALQTMISEAKMAEGWDEASYSKIVF
ncbi:hypothetical protein D9756_007057 [Leucocoprinus leucothites]|uniref:F-box domain-containing protein n=1 Tax=Leucocoprinus leucothites TaxID=201217 RepID=A0A8H5FY50_9AGAR|nr:hypothetical protein D9756_007057 [Leucoagaricus leucothites]